MDKDILHFAPEPQLTPIFAGASRTYVTADLDRADVDLQVDISQMPTLASASFDTVIVCDVLEHVPNDHAALSELYRILRPNGTAILTVPQRDDLESTHEDFTILEPAERERIFGQCDHVRMYGEDVASKVQATGFEVEAISASHFDAHLVQRYVLQPVQPSRHLLATNNRRIYFCKK